MLVYSARYTRPPARAAQGSPGRSAGEELEGLAHVHTSHHHVLLRQQVTAGPGPLLRLQEWLWAWVLFLGLSIVTYHMHSQFCTVDSGKYFFTSLDGTRTCGVRDVEVSGMPFPSMAGPGFSPHKSQHLHSICSCHNGHSKKKEPGLLQHWDYGLPGTSDNQQNLKKLLRPEIGS